MTWDYNDRLISSIKNGITTQYTYDYTGQRVSKIDANSVTIYSNKYFEVTPENTTKHIYVGLSLLLASVESGNSTDHLSGASVETDETGNIIEMTDYFPFGEVHTDQTTTTYKNPYKFTGKELDTDTNLYYYGARYYNAQLGRFISQDPWGGILSDPQSLNKYSYVMNNPLKYTDPSGKCVWDLCALETSAVIAATEAIIAIGGYLTYEALIPSATDGIYETPSTTESNEPYITPWITEQGLNHTGNTSPAPETNNVMTTPSTTPEISIFEFPEYAIEKGWNVMMGGFKDPKVESQYIDIKEIPKSVFNNNKTIAEGKSVKQVNRLIEQYGGKVSDWSKNTSKEVFNDSNGSKYQIHYYYNKALKNIFEPKKKYTGK